MIEMIFFPSSPITIIIVRRIKHM